jgi:hypothetical protein
LYIISGWHELLAFIYAAIFIIIEECAVDNLCASVEAFSRVHFLNKKKEKIFSTFLADSSKNSFYFQLLLELISDLYPSSRVPMFIYNKYIN